LYIGVTLLGFSEKEVWKMTPYKITRLFEIHKQFNPDQYGEQPPAGIDDIDAALGGL
jgi:hypothetical protein